MSIDILFTIIIVVAIGVGFIRGFVAEFFAIFGLLVTLLVCKLLISHILDFFHITSGHSVKVVVLYAGTFIVVYFLLNMGIKFLRVIIQLAMLQWIDRCLGAFLGAIKGGLIVFVALIVLMSLATMNNQCQKLLKGSYYAKAMLQKITIINHFLPEPIAKDLSIYRDKILLNQFMHGLETLYDTMNQSGETNEN